jgi:hypothetical protein
LAAAAATLGDRGDVRGLGVRRSAGPRLVGDRGGERGLGPPKSMYFIWSPEE